MHIPFTHASPSSCLLLSFFAFSFFAICFSNPSLIFLLFSNIYLFFFILYKMQENCFCISRNGGTQHGKVFKLAVICVSVKWFFFFFFFFLSIHTVLQYFLPFLSIGTIAFFSSFPPLSLSLSINFSDSKCPKFPVILYLLSWWVWMRLTSPVWNYWIK